VCLSSHYVATFDLQARSYGLTLGYANSLSKASKGNGLNAPT
jgi:hypothetical protein